ncbi:acyltransferase domain-containing protein [Orrella sp. JC864]|uniref:acyltransferase domain-containing protein n=1 Tax=Orrella sp. JC864 TaxID=3120298 RepID=UPI0012BD63C6
MSLAVLCPGQGSQHPAMFEKLRGDAAARSVLEHAATVLGPGWLALLDDPQALYANRNAQPLLCLAQYACWQALQDVLQQASAVAGYSAGEVSAYACAGLLDGQALAAVAAARARLMDQAARPGGLVAVRGLRRPQALALCRAHGAFVAIVNGEDAHVLGAPAPALAGLAAQAEHAGAQVAVLKVGVPSHTPLLADAVAPLSALLREHMRGALQKTVIAGISADRIATPAAAIDSLSRQVAQTIEWAACMDALYERGCRVFIELGPGNGLSRMVAARYADVRARSVDDFQSLSGVRAWVQRECDAMR